MCHYRCGSKRIGFFLLETIRSDVWKKGPQNKKKQKANAIHKLNRSFIPWFSLPSVSQQEHSSDVMDLFSLSLLWLKWNETTKEKTQSKSKRRFFSSLIDSFKGEFNFKKRKKEFFVKLLNSAASPCPCFFSRTRCASVSVRLRC